MSEIIVFPTVEKILGKLNIAFEQFYLIRDELLPLEMKKLEDALSSIKVGFKEAEEIQDQKRARAGVDFMLKRHGDLRSFDDDQDNMMLKVLRDACFDADDVLDEIAYKLDLRQKLIARGGLKTKAGCTISAIFTDSDRKFYISMARNVKDIRDRLVEVVDHMQSVHLQWEADCTVVVDGGVVRQSQQRDYQMTINTHSFVLSSDVMADKEKILHLLTVEDIDRNLTIIPILGIGETGLNPGPALLAYEDEAVKACFQLKMWIDLRLVGKDPVGAMQEILILATGEKCDDLSVDELHNGVRNSLQGNKFLLVLDHIQCDVQRKEWDEFIVLLDNGINGSKIVLTMRTKDSQISSTVATVYPYYLQELPYKDSWSSFVEHAFEEGEQDRFQQVVKLGKEIVRKCGGDPFAVKHVATKWKPFLLNQNVQESVKDTTKWANFLVSAGILQPLKLTYNQLPSYLKQVFSFCSLFPKGYVFDNLYLVRMWNAQGYLPLANANEDEHIQEIGDQYIKELLSKSLFQILDVGESYIRFKMHNLAHDLASFMARQECSLLDFPHDDEVPEQVRHVSFCSMSLSKELVQKSLSNLNKLRTLLLPIGKEWLNSELFVQKYIARFNSLWCLDLRHSNFTKLPSSIGKLKNLRYFDLSWNRNIEKLPDSVCQLLHLQTLALVGCISLEELPRDIGNLISLNSLSFTTRQSVLHMDKGIGCLMSLRHLTITGCDNLLSLGKGMQCLKTIRTLSIRSCSSLVSFSHSDLHMLTTLEISACGKLNFTECEGESFLTKLRFLFLSGLSQSQVLPPWLHYDTSNLEYISIANCENLTEIPTLRHFTWLRKLVIHNSPKLADLPGEMDRVPSLIELVIDKCPKISRRCKLEGGKDWCKIARIPDVTLDGEKIKSSGIQCKRTQIQNYDIETSHCFGLTRP